MAKLKWHTEYWIYPPKGFSGRIGRYEIEDGAVRYTAMGFGSVSSNLISEGRRRKAFAILSQMPSGTVMDQLFYTSKGRFSKRIWRKR